MVPLRNDMVRTENPSPNRLTVSSPSARVLDVAWSEAWSISTRGFSYRRGVKASTRSQSPCSAAVQASSREVSAKRFCSTAQLCSEPVPSASGCSGKAQPAISSCRISRRARDLVSTSPVPSTATPTTPPLNRSGWLRMNRSSSVVSGRGPRSSIPTANKHRPTEGRVSSSRQSASRAMPSTVSSSRRSRGMGPQQ